MLNKLVLFITLAVIVQDTELIFSSKVIFFSFLGVIFHLLFPQAQIQIQL